MPHNTTSFEQAVERNLRGVHFFSVGAMCGCDECGLSEDATQHEQDCANEGGFSWSSCDSCGSHLGGNRYPAHGIIAETMEAARGAEATHFDVCVDCLMYHANGDLPEDTQQRFGHGY